MAFRDPPELKRLRNERAPDLSCAEYLAKVIDRAPTLSEAAQELGVTRQTLYVWKAKYEAVPA